MNFFKFKFQKGVVDPISLIGVAFLILTLIIGTKVVKDKGFSLNISEYARITKDSDGTGVNSKNIETKVVEKKDRQQKDEVITPTTVENNPPAISESSGFESETAIFDYAKENEVGYDCSRGGCAPGVEISGFYKQGEKFYLIGGTGVTKEVVENYNGVEKQLIAESKAITDESNKNNCIQEGGQWTGTGCNYDAQNSAMATIGPKIVEEKRIQAVAELENIIAEREKTIRAEELRKQEEINVAQNQINNPTANSITSSYHGYGDNLNKDALSVQEIFNLTPAGIAINSFNNPNLYNGDQSPSVTKTFLENAASTYSFGRSDSYINSFQPDKVKKYWETEYNSRDECLENFSGKAKGYCDQTVYTAEQRKASTDLGVYITQLATAPLAVGQVLTTATAKGLLAAGGVAFQNMGTLSLIQQAPTAIDTCITNGIEDTKCRQEFARAFFTGISLGTGNAVSKAPTYLNRAANTIVSGGNFVVDSADTFDYCSGPNKDALNCAMSTFSLVADAWGLGADYTQGQLSFDPINLSSLDDTTGFGGFPDGSYSTYKIERPNTNDLNVALNNNSAPTTQQALVNVVQPDANRVNIPIVDVPKVDKAPTAVAPTVPRKTATEWINEQVQTVVNKFNGVGQPNLANLEADIPIVDAPVANVPADVPNITAQVQDAIADVVPRVDPVAPENTIPNQTAADVRERVKILAGDIWDSAKNLNPFKKSQVDIALNNARLSISNAYSDNHNLFASKSPYKPKSAAYIPSNDLEKNILERMKGVSSNGHLPTFETAIKTDGYAKTEISDTLITAKSVEEAEQVLKDSGVELQIVSDDFLEDGVVAWTSTSKLILIEQSATLDWPTLKPSLVHEATHIDMLRSSDSLLAELDPADWRKRLPIEKALSNVPQEDWAYLNQAKAAIYELENNPNLTSQQKISLQGKINNSMAYYNWVVFGDVIPSQSRTATTLGGNFAEAFQNAVGRTNPLASLGIPAPVRNIVENIADAVANGRLATIIDIAPDLNKVDLKLAKEYRKAIILNNFDFEGPFLSISETMQNSYIKSGLTPEIIKQIEDSLNDRGPIRTFFDSASAFLDNIITNNNYYYANSSSSQPSGIADVWDSLTHSPSNKVKLEDGKTVYIDGELKSGGQGDVSIGHINTENGQVKVVVKTHRPVEGNQSDFIARANAEEIEILETTKSSVKPKYYGRVDNNRIVIEHVEGTSVAEYLEDATDEQKVLIFQKIREALQILHSDTGLPHGDLNLAADNKQLYRNLILTTDEKIIFIDQIGMAGYDDLVKMNFVSQSNDINHQISTVKTKEIEVLENGLINSRTNSIGGNPYISDQREFNNVMDEFFPNKNNMPPKEDLTIHKTLYNSEGKDVILLDINRFNKKITIYLNPNVDLEDIIDNPTITRNLTILKEQFGDFEIIASTEIVKKIEEIKINPSPISLDTPEIPSPPSQPSALASVRDNVKVFWTEKIANPVANYFNPSKPNADYFERYGVIVPRENATNIDIAQLETEFKIQQKLKIENDKLRDPDALKNNRFINKTNGPVIEIGGPTLKGFQTIDIEEIIKPITVTNINDGVSNLNRGYVGIADSKLDVTKIDYPKNSVGAYIARAQNKNIYEQLLRNSYETLEPGGILVIEDILPSNIDGLEPESFGFKRIFESSGETKGTFNLILQKPKPNIFEATIIDTQNYFRTTTIDKTPYSPSKTGPFDGELFDGDGNLFPGLREYVLGEPKVYVPKTGDTYLIKPGDTLRTSYNNQAIIIKEGDEIMFGDYTNTKLIVEPDGIRVFQFTRDVPITVNGERIPVLGSVERANPKSSQLIKDAVNGSLPTSIGGSPANYIFAGAAIVVADTVFEEIGNYFGWNLDLIPNFSVTNFFNSLSVDDTSTTSNTVLPPTVTQTSTEVPSTVIPPTEIVPTATEIQKITTNDTVVKEEVLYNGNANYTKYITTDEILYHVVYFDLDSVDMIVGTQPGTRTTTSNFLEKNNLDIAINGDGWDRVTDKITGEFLRYEPGFSIGNGTQYKYRDANQIMYIDSNHQMQFTDSAEKIPDGTLNAISFDNWLVKDGNISDNSEKSDSNPRTAFGITADNQIILLVSDGKEYSSGMKVPDLAQLMKDMGAVNAVMFDGGTNATLVLGGFDSDGDANNGIDSVVEKNCNDGSECTVASHLGFQFIDN